MIRSIPRALALAGLTVAVVAVPMTGAATAVPSSTQTVVASDAHLTARCLVGHHSQGYAKKGTKAVPRDGHPCTNGRDDGPSYGRSDSRERDNGRDRENSRDYDTARDHDNGRDAVSGRDRERDNGYASYRDRERDTDSGYGRERERDTDDGYARFRDDDHDGHGKGDHGKGDHGKGDHGKGDHGKGDHGKGDHGKGKGDDGGYEKYSDVAPYRDIERERMAMGRDRAPQTMPEDRSLLGLGRLLERI